MEVNESFLVQIDTRVQTLEGEGATGPVTGAVISERTHIEQGPARLLDLRS